MYRLDFNYALEVNPLTVGGLNTLSRVFEALYKEETTFATTWAQLFKTNDVVSLRIVKILILKYNIYANIFAEQMWVAFAFAFAKATHIYSAKIPVNQILCVPEQLRFWPLTSSLN